MEEELTNLLVLVMIVIYIHWPFMLLGSFTACVSVLLLTLRRTNQAHRVRQWGAGLVLLTTNLATQKVDTFAYWFSWGLLLLFGAKIIHSVWMEFGYLEDDDDTGWDDDFDPDRDPTPTPTKSRPLSYL